MESDIARRPSPTTPEQITRYADMFAAMGTESRLRIVQLLLSAHPAGMVVGEIQAELDLSGSNLSHHLEKLRNEELVTVEREGTFLRYRANAEALRELLAFFYSECCTRSRAVSPRKITSIETAKEKPWNRTRSRKS